MRRDGSCNAERSAGEYRRHTGVAGWAASAGIGDADQTSPLGGAADPGRRFDDLFNFVCDPATLVVAFERVAGNQGANTPGVDGLTVAWVEEFVGVPGFLDSARP